MIKKIIGWLNRHSEIRNEVKKEMNAIEFLTIEDAYHQAINHIEKHPDYFEIILNKTGKVEESKVLDPLVASFFSKYEEVYLIGEDSRIRLFETPNGCNSGHPLVCKCEADGFEFRLEDGGPGLIECNPEKGKDAERFKSLFHFILMYVLD